MLRKHASLVIAMSLVALVVTACIVRTRPAGQPVIVEDHKEQKHKEQKHKDPHDNGHGHDDDEHGHGHGHGHD